MSDDVLKGFVGKVVATRGIGSGVHVGRVLASSGTQVLLEKGAFFMRNWEYKKSHGTFHSLASGDVVGGEITKLTENLGILDVSTLIVCPDSLLKMIEKYAK